MHFKLTVHHTDEYNINVVIEILQRSLDFQNNTFNRDNIIFFSPIHPWNVHL